MTRARPFRAARLGFAASLVGCVIAAVSCASPTQIIVEVFTDACPGSGKPEVVQATGIAVGTAENIENQRPASTKEGCETATGVGTLTIYPSGANDDEVALKVLGGVESAPDRCDPPAYAGCIVNRRMLRFIPHTTQRVTVVLSLACLNRQCPTGTTCDNGACVDPGQILADGGTNLDAPRTEAGTVAPPAPEGGPTGEAGVDAALPQCAGCQGACDGTKCIVDCTGKVCSGSLCASGLPCEIRCSDPNSCRNISCTANSCLIKCDDSSSCTNGIACNAATSCDVECTHMNACNSGQPIAVSAGGTGRINCNGESACAMANITCTATTRCDLVCMPGGGPKSACPFSQANRTCTSGMCMGFAVGPP